MLLDLRTVVRRASSGTVLSVSVQCTKSPQYAEAENDRAPGAVAGLDRFIAVFGRDRVPPATRAMDLVGWSFGTLSRTMLLQEIAAEMAIRNSTNATDVMCYRLVCEIEYEDGAKMTTITVIFYSPKDESLLNQCHFEGLDFLPNPLVPVRITVPKITAREFKKLESQLPLEAGGELVLGTIPAADARHFEKMYRYLPSFAVLEG